MDKQPPHPIDLTGASVLIADDSPANLNVLRDTLEPAGYHVLLAPNGETALKIALRRIPDLILLDVLMPDVDGYEVCRRLKQEPTTQHIPVIFVTALGDTQNLIDGFQVGGVDYIPKPFAEAEVHMRVQNHHPGELRRHSA